MVCDLVPFRDHPPKERLVSADLIGNDEEGCAGAMFHEKVEQLWRVVA
jgi:hypothetical protein